MSGGITVQARVEGMMELQMHEDRHAIAFSQDDQPKDLLEGLKVLLRNGWHIDMHDEHFGQVTLLPPNVHCECHPNNK